MGGGVVRYRGVSRFQIFRFSDFQICFRFFAIHTDNKCIRKLWSALFVCFTRMTALDIHQSRNITDSHSTQISRKPVVLGYCSRFWIVLVGFVGFVGGFGSFWVVLAGSVF